MRNTKKIVTFVLLGILFVQNSFFGVVFAESNACVRPAEYNSCSSYSSEYSKKTKINNSVTNQKEVCCECETPSVNKECSEPGYVDNGNGCCRYNCVTCNQASYEFQTYVNFQVELLQILQKALREKEENQKPKIVGLFSAGILKLPANLIKSWVTMLKKGAEEMVDGYRSVKMGAIMLGSITTEIISKDGVGGLKILFRNEQFVREWTTLQDLDMSIHDAMRDLGMEGIWDDGVSGDIITDIGKLKSKYIKNKGNELGLFEKFDVPGDVKYKDIVNLMLKLNAVMKMFVSNYSNMITSGSFKMFLGKISDDVSKGNIVMRFNIDLMEKMFDSYRCAVGVSACSNMWKDFANNTKVWAQIKKGLTDSGDIIKKANEEFVKAMLGFGSSVKDTFSSKAEDDESGLTTKQLVLLRGVYGIDTTKLSKEQGIGLESLLNGSAGKNIVNSVNLKSLDYFSTESKNLREEAKKIADKEKADNRYLEKLSVRAAQDAETELEETLKEIEAKSTYKSKDLRKSLLDTWDIVLVQKQEDEKIFLIYSNLSITAYFVQIGYLIHNILDESISTKDDDGLVKYLGEACEAQCTNKGTKNCYAR